MVFVFLLQMGMGAKKQLQLARVIGQTTTSYTKMSKTIYGLSRSRDKHGNIVKRNLNDVVNCIHTNAGSGYKTMEILIVEIEDEDESNKTYNGVP